LGGIDETFFIQRWGGSNAKPRNQLIEEDIAGYLGLRYAALFGGPMDRSCQLRVQHELLQRGRNSRGWYQYLFATFRMRKTKRWMVIDLDTYGKIMSQPEFHYGEPANGKSCWTIMTDALKEIEKEFDAAVRKKDTKAEALAVSRFVTVLGIQTEIEPQGPPPKTEAYRQTFARLFEKIRSRPEPILYRSAQRPDWNRRYNACPKSVH